jgi:hypothetical protein
MTMALFVFNRCKPNLPRFGDGCSWVDPFSADEDRNIAVILEVNREYLRKFLGGVLRLQRYKVPLEVADDDGNTGRRAAINERLISDADATISCSRMAIS